MKRLIAWPIVLALVLGGCGDGKSGDEGAAKDPFRAVPQKTIIAPVDKAGPRWEVVASFSGTQPATKTVSVAKGAIQWRVRWRCESGRLAVSISPAPRTGSARGASNCPKGGQQSWVVTGRHDVRVNASGRWSMVVEQEVDTALKEAPLASMQSERAKVLARGRFYRIERKGRGSAVLYRLASGRLALRLENFATDANTDLFVWLSESRRPKNTEQSFRSRHIQTARLKSTLGDQNYLLPRRLNPNRIRSIVIWCEPVRIAYTAAALVR